MAMQVLKMVRKDGKPGEVRVYERDVAAYEASGWKLVDVPRLPATPVPEPPPPAEDEDNPFEWAKTEPGDKAK